LNQARVKLPGSSDSGIKSELYETIREFLQDSNAWVENISLLVTAGVLEYLLVPRGGGQITRLDGVWDGNRTPVPASMPDFSTLVVHQPIQVSSVAPVSTVTTLSAQNPWLVSVIKNIVLPTTRDNIPIAPEFILKVYEPYILDGVLGRMMTHQAKSYSNQTLGVYHLRRFEDGKSQARVAANRQNLLGGQNWKFPQSFRTRGQRGGVSTAWPTETFR
jgi:hypothetical protein